MMPRLYLNRKPPVMTYALAVLNVLTYLADAACRYLIFGVPLLTLLGAKENVSILVYG